MFCSTSSKSYCFQTKENAVNKATDTLLSEFSKIRPLFDAYSGGNIAQRSRIDEASHMTGSPETIYLPGVGKVDQKDCLKPNVYIDSCISSIIDVITSVDDPSIARDVINKLRETSPKAVEIIQSTCATAEEFLEKKILSSFFSKFENQMHLNVIPTESELSESIRSLNVSEKDKKFISSLQKVSPPGFDMVEYLMEYKTLVDAELKLLTQGNKLSDKPVAAIHEMKDKTFCFVGCGFPVTAIFLHLKTDAAIQMVDIDGEAVKNCSKLLGILDQLGVINKEKFNVRQANAMDVKYVKPEENSSLKKGSATTDQNIVKADYLDLASALPNFITDHILKENVSGIDAVRKRTVVGLGQLLYDAYQLPEETNYQHAGRVAPPHKANSAGSNLIHISDKRNATVCDLFIPSKK